jgi:predicted Fe-Mo cluster-binding NifX family protein
VNAVVAIVSSRAEAELIVGMLRNHGVKAVLSADDLGGVDMALQMQGVRVLVADHDERKARDLLNQRESSALVLKPPNGFQRWLLKLLGGKL